MIFSPMNKGQKKLDLKYLSNEKLTYVVAKGEKMTSLVPLIQSFN